MSRRLVVVVISVILAGVSCVPTETSAYRRTPGPTSGGAAASGAAVGIQRDPADLPVLPGESAVMSAFARAGMPVRMIGASKFEGMLGSMRPARVFTAATTWGAEGADVLFLDEPIADGPGCATPGPPCGRAINAVSADGKRVERTEPGQPVRSETG